MSNGKNGKSAVQTRQTFVGKAPYDKAGTRSDHIRSYFKTHHNNDQRKASVVVKALADAGITVSIPLVQNVKTQLKVNKAKAKANKVQNNGKISVPRLRGQQEDLTSAVIFVKSVGGLPHAKQALELLEELQVG